MDTVVHIGVEKTGTTSIQRFLADNAVLLKQQGWNYPSYLRTPNHHSLAAYAVDASDRIQDIHEWSGITADNQPDRRRDFEVTFRKNVVPGKWIFSSEHLSARILRTDEIGRLRELFSSAQLDPRIVFYVRRQERMIPSVYSTAIKGGSVAEFDLKHMLSLRRFNFARLYSMWDEMFPGHVQVRPYVEDLAASRLTDDFAATVGFRVNSDFIVPQDRLNLSLSEAALEELRQFNIATRNEPGFRARKAKRIQELLSSDSGSPLRLSPEDAERVAKRFEDSNRWLAEQCQYSDTRDLLLGEV